MTFETTANMAPLTMRTTPLVRARRNSGKRQFQFHAASSGFDMHPVKGIVVLYKLSPDQVNFDTILQDFKDYRCIDLVKDESRQMYITPNQ